MHWSQSVAKILKEGTGDLKDLAAIAGEDWRILYRYQSLAGCDLRGQDLTGMDLTGCEIDKALIDQRTAIDVEFDPRPNIRTGYYHVSLPRILNKAILSFASERHYVYTAWAYKALIERFANITNYNSIDDLEEKIRSNPVIEDLVLKDTRQKKMNTTILIYHSQINSIERSGRNYPRYNEFGFALLSGLLLYRFKMIRRVKLEGLTLNALWPGLVEQEEVGA